MEQVKVSLPRQVIAWIRSEAKRRCASESQVMREMLVEVYERNRSNSKKE